MWFVFALLSAIFAALTSILAKVGIDGVNSNLATAIRTVVVVVMAWGMVFLTNAQNGIKEISRKSWIFLIISVLLTVGFVHKQSEVFVRKLPVLMPALIKYRHVFYKNSPSSTSCTA